MHVLVVVAHPEHHAFTWEVAEAFCRGLERAGHTWEVADLYAEGFNPLLEAQQFGLETAMDPATARPADVQREQNRLGRAEGLAFVYPFWWSDVPAILKGWFDRVWSYGFAYAYQQDRTRSTRLRIRKALALCIAGHSDELLEAKGLRDAHRRVMVEDRLLGVGIPDASLELLGGLAGNLPEARARVLAQAQALGLGF